MIESDLAVGVVGGGTMGLGIAEVCACAGFRVWVQDVALGFAESGRQRVTEQLQRRVARGRMTAADLEATMRRIGFTGDLPDLKSADLVVEAVPETLELKRKVFADLEQIVGPSTLIATNTSSFSVTALAARTGRPERFAGLHFFNPVPAMKLVEVIAGERTDPTVVPRLRAFVERLGHTPVVASDTPGFIVNHVGRAFTTEALVMLAEGIASVVQIDTILREAAGFRMGPFQLLDITGLDVSQPVMESIFQQFYAEPRFRPSFITARRLSGGLLGRKSGRGFYDYAGAAVAEPLKPDPASLPRSLRVLDGPGAELVTAVARGAGVRVGDDGDIVLMPLVGDDATTRAVQAGVDPERAVGFDAVFGLETHRTLVSTICTEPDVLEAAKALMSSDGVASTTVADSVGSVCQRVHAVMVNIACDAVQHGVAGALELDSAARLGLGYPKGPLAWADEIGLETVLRVTNRIHALTADPRYRPSNRLRRCALAGVPLCQSVVRRLAG